MSLLEIFKKLDKSEIDGFIACQQEEHLTLDFKTINNPKLTNNDDKRNLAKSLSGFANSSGGIVVWGVEAKKNNQGIDCATKIIEIENVKLFLSRLNELSGMAVSPIVDGVMHRVIETTPGKGIVVTYIPESDSGPHMAKMGEDRYYKRSGDSFYRLEHFDLEDMFGRRPKPDLMLHTRIKGSGLNVQVVLGIRNNGRGSAKAPYLAFNASPPFKLNAYGLDGNKNEGMRKLPYLGTDLPYRYGEGANVVIHPGVTHEVASIYLGLNPSIDQKPKEDLLINYEIAAEGFMLVRDEKIIPLSELV